MKPHPIISDEPVLYRIEIRGRLDQSWSDWLENLAVSVREEQSGSITTLQGVIQDQAVLHGLLARLHDLGLVLLRVERCSSSEP